MTICGRRWHGVRPSLTQADTMLRLATALSAFWWRHLGEGVDWIHRALRRGVRPPADAERTAVRVMRLRARVLLEAGSLASMWGDDALARTDDEREPRAVRSTRRYIGPVSQPRWGAGNSAEGYRDGDRLDGAERWPCIVRWETTSMLSNVLWRSWPNRPTSRATMRRARRTSPRHWTSLAPRTMSSGWHMCWRTWGHWRFISRPQGAPSACWRRACDCRGGSSFRGPAWPRLGLDPPGRSATCCGGHVDAAGSASGERRRSGSFGRKGWPCSVHRRRALVIAMALLEIGEMVYEQGDDARAG